MTPRVALLLQVRQETLEVEFPLIEGQLDEIDQKLQRALQELNWKSEGAWEYIQETRDKVGARSTWNNLPAVCISRCTIV